MLLHTSARTRAALTLALLAAAPLAAQACSSCGCTLHTDWPAQGLDAGRGASLDLRHDFFDQDDLRQGRGSVDRGAITLPAEQEIQQRTVNRNSTATLDLSVTPQWGLSLMLPWIDRVHTTVVDGDTEVSTSRSSSLGDVRLMARTTALSEDGDWGVQFGLKLPTGGRSVRFDAGPQAGEALDRGLQPGTGSTDLLLGAYRFGALGPGLEYFAQGLLQWPLKADAAFKPGVGVNLSAGLRWNNDGALRPQLQLNVRSERPETGTEADTANSGATLVYLSPGLSWTASEHLRLYGYLQAPLWQNVRGLQIEPRLSISVGASVRF